MFFSLRSCSGSDTQKPNPVYNHHELSLHIFCTFSHLQNAQSLPEVSGNHSLHRVELFYLSSFSFFLSILPAKTEKRKDWRTSWVLKTERITHNCCISFCYFHFLCKTTLSQQLPFPCLDGFQFGSLSKDGLRHQVFLVRLRQLRAEVRLVEASLDVWELSFDGFYADLRMLYVLQQDGDDDFP